MYAASGLQRLSKRHTRKETTFEICAQGVTEPAVSGQPLPPDTAVPAIWLLTVCVLAN